ncbi:hypothetical protein BDN70DRAFT_887335, partial [Pholiota conissans]
KIIYARRTSADSPGVADEILFLSFAVQRVKTLPHSLFLTSSPVPPSPYPYHRTFASGIYISKSHLHSKRTYHPQ